MNNFVSICSFVCNMHCVYICLYPKPLIALDQGRARVSRVVLWSGWRQIQDGAGAREVSGRRQGEGGAAPVSGCR